jgi:hypothetical protein
VSRNVELDIQEKKQQNRNRRKKRSTKYRKASSSIRFSSGQVNQAAPTFRRT